MASFGPTARRRLRSVAAQLCAGFPNENLDPRILAANRAQAKKMREYMVRAVYVEMLGHDAGFAHIHAVKLTHEKNLTAKRVGSTHTCAEHFMIDNGGE